MAHTTRSTSLVLSLLAAAAFAGCDNIPEFVSTGTDGKGGPGENQDGSGAQGNDDLDVNAGGGAGGADPGTVNECDSQVGSCEEELEPPEPACGDGRINVAGETCDDGNGESGDGCTANCDLEANFVCATPGEKCTSTVECGDSKITGEETCDDGNSTAGDGCDASCAIEAGWACDFPGLRCVAAECGDSLVVDFEECDFGGDVTGCTSCLIDDGYDCDGASCTPTVCGNGTVERGEQCEDGNARPFDGCYKCASEPSCTGGVCNSVCGDGQRYDDEACDDGNARDGDGCSSTCEVELGFACGDIAGTPPETLSLPIIFRDFIGRSRSNLDTSTCYGPREESPTAQKTIPCYHINFNNQSGTSLQGVVENDLGADGTPDMICPGGDCSGNVGVPSGNFTNNDDFEDWYDDADPESLAVYDELTLTRGAGLTYNFSPSGPGFYPLDNKGWVASGEENQVDCNGGMRNVSFSSETRFYFEYQGGERFDFNGDDDLWVFVNGKLAIDLSGLHGPRGGYFQLDDDTDGAGLGDVADGTALINNDLITETPLDLGLVPGGIYEVALFHAERNQCGSNFEVTLKDFNKPKSKCESTCGDGIVASDEFCDDGMSGNDGAYGNCSNDCLSRGPYCGDGTQQETEGEQCDDGVNLSTYGTGCAPGCVTAPNCGDGQVQSTFEDCDDGDNNGGYGECAQGCVLGPRCGDGVIQSADGEECDDGNRINGDECNVNCKDEVSIIK